MLQLLAISLLIAETRAALVSAGTQDAIEDSAAAALWDGMDVAEDWRAIDEAVDHTSSFAQLGSTIRRNNRAVTVQIMGLMDTGTNLLQQILWHNFPMMNFFAEFPATDGASEEKMRRLSEKGVWKHANLVQVNEHMRPRIRESFASEEAAMIAMVRQPLSWLQSIKKAPYKLQNCVGGSDWLQRPCVHPIPAGHAGVDHEIQHNVTYSNLMDIWNHWLRSYEDAWPRMFRRALFIRYEDLVLEPVSVIREIARQLNVTEPANFVIPVESAKKSGLSSGRAEAVDKIRTKGHLWKFAGGELHSACTSLDEDIAEQFGYDECKRIVEEAAMMAQTSGRVAPK